MRGIAQLADNTEAPARGSYDPSRTLPADGSRLLPRLLWGPPMTRRGLLALLPAAGFAQQPNPLALQYSTYGPIDPVTGIPGSSSAYSKYGVIVQVYDDNHGIDAYMVNVRYLDSANAQHAVTRLAMRQQEQSWTTVGIETGGPVQVISVEAAELRIGRRIQLP